MRPPVPHSQHSRLESPRADRSLGPARVHRLDRKGRRRARGRRRQFLRRQRRRSAQALRFDFTPSGPALLVRLGIRLADSDHARDGSRWSRSRASPPGLQPRGDEARCRALFRAVGQSHLRRRRLPHAGQAGGPFPTRDRHRQRDRGAQIPRSAFRAGRFAIGALPGTNGARPVELLRLGLGRRDAVVAALGSRRPPTSTARSRSTATLPAVPSAS